MNKKNRIVYVVEKNDIKTYSVDSTLPNPFKKVGRDIVLQWNNKQLNVKHSILNDDTNTLSILDDQQRDMIFQYDLSKEKFASCLKAKDVYLRDFSKCSGKNIINENLLGISSNSIHFFDNRQKKDISKSKEYKSNTQFNKILGTDLNSFVVGSETGDVRFYNSFGKNSKNLIPAPNQDPVICMDSSKDGRLLLLTFKDCLVLLPTFQRNKSVFDHNLKKGEKPIPYILKIHPMTLVKHKIEKVNFISAHFDEKVKKGENFIVGVASDCLVFWSLP